MTINRCALYASLWSFAALLYLIPSPAAAQQVVNVHPVAGDPIASGNALLSAVAGITDASATKPYVVKVDPGIFNLGTSSLTMKQYVDLEGTGQLATVIQGTGQMTNLNGVINAAANAEVRELQVQSQASGNNVSIGIFASNVNTSIRDVTIVSTGGTALSATYGIRNLDANSTIQGVTITATGGGSVYGMSMVGLSNASAPFVRRAVVSVSSSAGGTGYGIYVTGLSVPDLRDIQVTASGGNQAVGLAFDYGNTSTGPFYLLVEEARISAGSTVNNSGILLTGNGNSLDLNTSRISSGGGSLNYALQSTDNAPRIDVDRSELSGSTNSLNATGAAAVFIGASRLGGPVSAPSPYCAATYRSANYHLVTTSCVFQ
jgi:hypothetical protein